MNAIASLPSVDAPVLLGVNLDGDAGRAAAVAESLHLSLPMVVDAKQSVGRLYRVDDPPLTLLVDPRRPGARRRGTADQGAAKLMTSNMQVTGRRWLLAVTAFAAIGAALTAGRAHAEAPPAAEQARGVDQDVQVLKKQLVDLNRDLFKLEEELLYPTSTQVAVFLSVDVGTFFALDSVTLKVDDKEVAHYLYTDREVQALHRGGVQKLYLGNLKAGPHEIVAFFTGKGPHDRDYRRGAALTFDKKVGAKYIELSISDRPAALEPEFVVRQWE